MFSIKPVTNFKRINNRNTIVQNIRFFMKNQNLNQMEKPILRQTTKTDKKIGPFGWFLLAIPASTFALGTWQIQRKKWKEDLIVKLKDLTSSTPVQLPDNLQDLEKMEYQPIYVRGRFLHDRELYLGPRSLLTKGDASTRSSLLSTNTEKSQGYLIITPFKLADRDESILVNRGWVPHKNKNATTRSKGQVEGDVELIGIVRLTEHRPQFTPKNDENSNQWFYKDLQQMAKATGASPILLDATDDFNIRNGPIGGQTRVSLRNEHLSYVLTWYSLCAATSYMWYKHFLKK